MNNSFSNIEPTDEKNESANRIPARTLEDMKQKMSAELSHFKDRDYEWLWKYLGRRVKSGLDAYRRYEERPDARKTKLAHIIVVNKILLTEILDSHSAQVLDLSYFDWIDQKNKRQLIFVYFLMLKKGGRHRNNEQLNSPDLFGQIINSFDNECGTMRKKEKNELINDFRRDWDTERAPDNLVKWIDPNNTPQLEWALDYLKKKDEWIKDLLVDSAKNHLYALILASLDNFSIEYSQEATQLFMTKMSKTWSQKKFRDAGKAKNPYHIPLTKQAKKQLDEQAEFYNMKTNALLEAMISQGYKEMIDEKGKKKY